MRMVLETTPYLSVVIPVYNEEDSLFPLHEAVTRACTVLKRPYEICFVDDGSTDRTPALLRELHARDRAVTVVFFRKNYGQTAAMAAGFDTARGAVVVSMDGDLQNDPADIPRLLEKLEEGYDVVCGWRKRRRDKFWSRRFPSMIANWIIGRVTGVRIHDNGCSLKAYRTSVIKNVSLYGEMHRFIPAMSTLTGARVTEMVVNHHPRRFGQSKYGIGRVWRVILDIFTVKMITGFAARPALWFGAFAFFFMLTGSAVFAGAFGFLMEGAVDPWLVLVASGLLFFALSMHLLAMGIVGELAMQTGEYRPLRGLQPNMLVLS